MTKIVHFCSFLYTFVQNVSPMFHPFSNIRGETLRKEPFSPLENSLRKENLSLLSGQTLIHLFLGSKTDTFFSRLKKTALFS